MKPKKSKFSPTGLTLTELLIAIGFVGVSVLAIMATDVAARRFLSGVEYESRVQNEVSPILELMVKDISRAIGDKNNPGIAKISDNTTLRIRHIDSNDANFTYGDYTDDNWIAYRYFKDVVGSIQKYPCLDPPVCTPPSNFETLAQNIFACQFNLTPDNAVSITITARRDADPASSLPEIENPEVILQTTVFPRLSSLN